MNEAAGKILRFAGITLDGAQGRLHDPNGLEVRLAPKPFDLLLVLARNAGRIMSKDALLSAVWPGVHVTEDSLFQAVREARRAIGDEAGRVLRALPRRGYILDSDVIVVAEAQGTERPLIAPASARLVPPADKPSIVVLPFTNISADPEQDYFVDGLVEDITTALSRIRSFFVIARNSAFAYKGRVVDVREVGRELGVGYVLEGSVRKAGGRIRVTGELADSRTGAQIWADWFDGPLDEVFLLQDRVTEAVAGAIEPHLQRAEIERALRRPTEDLGAYDLYLRGIAVFQDITPDSIREARDYFVRAFAQYPNYGAAYGMASLCVAQLKTQWDPDLSAATKAEALAWARKAAETGRDDATALWTAGITVTYLGMDPEAGILLLDRACAINPNSARAWSRAGAAQNYLGDPAKAITSYERACRLSPQDPLRYIDLNGMAFALMQVGAYEEAVASAARSVSEKSGWALSQRNFAAALALSGRVKEAQHAMAELLRLAPTMRLAMMAEFSGPLRNQDYVARLTEALRLAGMPE